MRSRKQFNHHVGSHIVFYVHTVCMPSWDSGKGGGSGGGGWWRETRVPHQYSCSQPQVYSTLYIIMYSVLRTVVFNMGSGSRMTSDMCENVTRVWLGENGSLHRDRPPPSLTPPTPTPTHQTPHSKFSNGSAFPCNALSPCSNPQLPMSLGLRFSTLAYFVAHVRCDKAS